MCTTSQHDEPDATFEAVIELEGLWMEVLNRQL